jgi:Thymidylate synthase complementing protein
MTITAQIIADSISPDGIRLTTMQLRYPRFIHAELMTHRMFSRNASSSRAIPVQKMIEDLRRDPAMPVHWGANQKGMQAAGELDKDTIGTCQCIWLDAMETAIGKAEWLMRNDLHKQIANRILEPWAHINVVVTATDWANFFALRSHENAQPEIKVLSDAMMVALGTSDPELLVPGQWHLPYIDQDTWNTITDTNFDWLETGQKVSVARCARVSYLTHDGRQTTVEEDLNLYERLLGSTPLHASPAEHQATPDRRLSRIDKWDRPDLHGNFTGWIQYRKTLPNEYVPG